MPESPSIVGRFEAAQDRLVLQASDLSLETVSAMVDSEAIDIRPEFQRRDRWDPQRQSALIESFLINVPVPPVYLSEDEYGTYSVIDGKQRLTAIHAFMRDKLKLSGLVELEGLNGYRFSELPPQLANALRVRPYIRAVTLLKQSDPELRYEVFTRLNTGGEPLNAQEIRNVAFRGPMNELVYELSEHPFLRHQLKIGGPSSPAYRNMTDAEYVLRFLTLRELWQTFPGELRRAMDFFMYRHRWPDPGETHEYRLAFTRSIEWCAALWGQDAFRRPYGDAWRDQTLAGMFDAQMVAVDTLPDESLQSLAGGNLVKSATRQLFEDRAFDDAVRQATNTPSRIYYRVTRLIDTLQHLADHDGEN